MMHEQLTNKQKLAFNKMLNGKNVFLTGPGGSGKSFLLKYFINYYKSNLETEKSLLYVTSTTGLSALLIDGITINRYAGIGIGDKDVENYYQKIKRIKFLYNKWLNTKVLIIDEISMMNADLFDKLESLARKVRMNKLHFGGIQIILSGDFLQLPPVKSDKFCFEAHSWKIIDNIFYFNEIIRQSDILLQNVLNNIRIGVVNEEVKELLDSCLDKDLNNDLGIIPTLLFSKKDMVKKYNETELNKLINLGNVHYKYDSTYEFEKNITNEIKNMLKEMINGQFQIEDSVTLSIGSQVMLTVNMPEHGLSNGSRGIIVDFSCDKKPTILFLDGKKMVIKEFEYLMETDDGKIVKKIQIPFILAWAVTIHKAQGMSLDYVKTDIGETIFEYGQAYVVLSRIKNIEGLSLIKIDYSKIKAHPKILDYYESLTISSIPNSADHSSSLNASIQSA